MANKSPFPEELVLEILLRLPVKSILKCKTLSKHYYSLIRSQFFTRRHRSRILLNDKLNNQLIMSPMRDTVRLFNRRCHIDVLEVSPPIVGESSNVSDQIICGLVEGLYWVVVPMQKHITVWNPSTREQLRIPRAPRTYYSSEGLCGCGFGYDDTMNDYKVVLIYGSFSNTSATKSFYIFNVSKGEWRNIEDCLGVIPSDIRSIAGVFFRGSCHWVYALPHDRGYNILAFDMVVESNKFIPFPLGDEHMSSDDMSIITLNGCLGFVNARDGDMFEGLYSSFDVWVMSEYDNAKSWTVLHRVSLANGLMGRFLGIVRDRFYYREENYGLLVSYDLESSMEDECSGILDRSVGCLLPYEESLVRIIKSD